jgi:NTE family protein
MRSVGIALGGGVVLGAAHIGVLKAIEEHGLEIKYLSGTSIGALVAALYAFGHSTNEIERISLKMKWIDVAKLSLSKYGLLSNEKLGKLIRRHIGEKDIRDAAIPFSMVATDIETGEKVIINEGRVDKAIMASTCVPGLFKPVEFGDRMLVDGGVVENVPIQTARDHIDLEIIGVDLNARQNFERPGHVVDVILNSYHIISRNSTKAQTKEADLLVEPDLSKFNGSDPKQVPDLIQTGYEAGMRALADWTNNC